MCVRTCTALVGVLGCEQADPLGNRHKHSRVDRVPGRALGTVHGEQLISQTAVRFGGARSKKLICPYLEGAKHEALRSEEGLLS